jgi:Cu/Ag efflux pump CusA
MDDKQFVVRVDAMPLTLQALNHVPIKLVGPTTVYLSDVAHVADAWAVQQNIVHAEGK